MVRLPIAFENRMREMLGEEFPAFLESYEKAAKKGLRVNRLKISPEAFETIAPFALRKVPWVENGYFYDLSYGEAKSADAQPSRHPFYAAGLYYLQEPSAMTPASRLEIVPGERVLDLCAAPGGKATELAAKLKGQGILVANEISNSRAKALLRNLELFGAENCFVTNEEPARLAERFAGFFDKILVDAPCSGEGMFHKQQDVIATWSQERVTYFANLQRSILEEAEKMLRPGGMLMYSTCTFSPEENEQTIAAFLQAHPQMHLREIAPYEGFRAAVPAWAQTSSDSFFENLGADYEELRKCVRIWPHHMEGEGHFLALMYKESAGEAVPVSPCESVTATEDVFALKLADEAFADFETAARERAGQAEFPEEEELTAAEARRMRKKKERAEKKASRMQRDARKNASGVYDQRQNKGKRSGRNALKAGGRNAMEAEGIALCMDFMKELGIEIDVTRLECRGDKVYYVSNLLPAVAGLHFLRNGVYVGDIKKDRFEPSQPFALTLGKESCQTCIDFAPEDARLRTYMTGGTIVFSEENKNISNGWKLICVSGYGIGWGKYVKGVLKNKYPLSWRGNA